MIVSDFGDCYRTYQVCEFVTKHFAFFAVAVAVAVMIEEFYRIRQ